MWLGILACIVAAVCLGSVFAPIKKFPPSDGIMAQFFICLGAFMVSLVVHAAHGFPPIYPLAMLGGAFWCSANACAVPLMNKLGMALGFLIWNSVSCLTGWATSRFGLFGVPVSNPKWPIVSYLGVAILLVGSSCYLFIKSDVEDTVDSIDDSGEATSEKKFQKRHSSEGLESEMIITTDPVSTNVRVICIIIAIICGLFLGSMCTPITYLQTLEENPSEGLPYLFSFFCGVLPTSTIILLGYSIIKKNTPSMPPNLVLPATFGGVLFGIGQGGFFVGNEQLSQTVAYPICCFAPAIVISIWSVFYFGEIRGRKNLFLLGVAYFLTAVGLVMVTISSNI